ncbi:hypothetical protein HOU25_gp55 [Corynebacterium phage Juicebox]|uniref:4Fe-4S Wbl-type domain-containing protein n=1 Tax=Corynebacterium phage Juicebox TaxID=2301600 RepID=A0A385UHX2_9CAUD|nr:hypothetical protein HOU25_gp55 [Corynebacterium phage Juicebox]AYB69484.1 hypothetical protein JUICEBOX_55 [Corynebacterium phage Juicebox]
MTARHPMSPDTALNAAPCRANPQGWDSRGPYEDSREAEHRHRMAIHRCRRCPALDACTRYLQEREAEGEPIDGIVAGRLWRSRAAVTIVGDCADCGAAMAKAGTPVADRLTDDGRVIAGHAGRGVCTRCWHLRRGAGTLHELPSSGRGRQGSAA